jgi:hypothetical protein
MGLFISVLVMAVVMGSTGSIMALILKGLIDSDNAPHEDTLTGVFVSLIILIPTLIFWYAGDGLEYLFPVDGGLGAFIGGLFLFPVIVTNGVENLLLNGLDINSPW